MEFIVSLFVTFIAAIVMIVVGVPDRWLYPAALVIYVLLVIVLHGAESEAHS